MSRIEYTFAPLTVWPGSATHNRQRSRFRAGMNATNDLLDRELLHLRARNVVIQLALHPSDIRLDGKPRADARPSHPGVVLSFESKHGPLQYPCDAFDDWRENLRAIALALEHLRTVERYGVAGRAQQYTGWKQLPPPGTSNNGHMTLEQAAAIVCQMGGGLGSDVLTKPDYYREAYRRAAKATHPDAGGNEAQFKQLQAAAAVLEKHHGVG